MSYFENSRPCAGVLITYRAGAIARTAHIAALVLGVLSATPIVAARAQDQPGALRLGDVYRAVRESSPRGEAAQALARAARARIPSAGLPPDPELQLGFMNYELPQLRPMEPLGMTQLQVMQMLPLGKLGPSRRVAAARANVAGSRAAEVGWELRSEAAMAFYELHRIDRSLDVMRESLRLLQDIARTTDAMYRVGEGRQTDVLRATVEIARMSEDTLRMQAMRTARAAGLNALLDRPAEAFVATPALPAFPADVPMLDSLQRLALAFRPMLDAGEHEVEAAEAGERLARREIWPDLTIGLQYGQRSSGMGIERMGSLMLGATVPLFARSRQLRMRDEMAAMREMAEAELTTMRAETRGSIAEAHAELMRARRLSRLYRTTVIPQAEAAAASALAAYRAGTVDLMTLLDARMVVNEYRQTAHGLEAEEGRAWAELEMLTGRALLDPDAPARHAPGGAQ